MKVSIEQLAKIMVSCLMNLVEEGELDAGDHSFEDVFGFTAEDVSELHTHKIGHGDGVWFRLLDGRVISAFAEESAPERHLYDTVAN